MTNDVAANGLTGAQVTQLLRPIREERVGNDGKGHAAVPQQDIRAHLIRIFGFGNWEDEILSSELVFETPRRQKPDEFVTAATRFDVCYRVTMRLRIKDQTGRVVATYDDSAADTAENQKRGDAHGMALRSATSLALKRCAINLGDQFGLGLYNGGSFRPIVMGTLIGMPDLTDESADEGDATDVQDGIPEAAPDEAMGGQDPDAATSEARQESEPVRDVREDEHRAIEAAKAQGRPAEFDPEQASQTGNGWRTPEGQQLPQGEPGDPFPGEQRVEDVPTDRQGAPPANVQERPAQAPQQGHAPALPQARARHRNALQALHPDWTEQQRREATIGLLAQQKERGTGWPVTLDTATSENWNIAAQYWEAELEEERRIALEGQHEAIAEGSR